MARIKTHPHPCRTSLTYGIKSHVPMLTTMTTMTTVQVQVQVKDQVQVEVREDQVQVEVREDQVHDDANSSSATNTIY